jgi:hypothetical protein
MNKSGFVHTLPSGRLTWHIPFTMERHLHATQGPASLEAGIDKPTLTIFNTGPRII